jgi:uncharacterized metal-binding protein
VKEGVVIKEVLRLCIALCVYLMFVTFYGKPHAVSSLQELKQLQSMTHKYCEMNHPETAIPLYCMEALALVYGYYLCYATRGVSDGVNDAHSIAVGEYYYIYHVFILL